MNRETAEILCKITNDFYRNQCASFSATRTAPWTGWKRCFEKIQEADPGVFCKSDFSRSDFSVFDLACGNLRFEAFLESEFPDSSIAFYAVDTCDVLVPQTPQVNYQSLDIMGVLQKDLLLSDQLTAPQCDLSVSFGFMHHIPLQEHRKEILLNLVKQTRSGGFVIVSFWQFLNNEAMAKKAQITHEHALEELGLEEIGLQELDATDYLLGWKNLPGEYRYCHSFSETEIDRLIESVADKASVVSRFVADGRTDNLNAYLILKVH